MNITSIDNCYEDDGLVLVQGFLMGLNLEAQQIPNDPSRRVLVAILPEFRDDGQLDRLNMLTVPAEDPGMMSAADMQLLDAAVDIIRTLQQERAKARDRNKGVKAE